MSFAILLPLTSRNCEPTILPRLNSLATQMVPQKQHFRVYFGIDFGDPILDKPHNPAEIPFENVGIECCTNRFHSSQPPSICSIWRSLGCRAYEDGCEYFLLFGDDVQVETPTSWIEDIIKAFHTLHSQLSGLPFGFGCVALNDRGAPGFPTFPVVHRIHLDIFGKELIVPTNFINQDGDPFLYQLYKRWGASIMLPHVIICNTIGGMQLTEEKYTQPRYDRIHIEWKYDILQTHITKLEDWINKSQNNPTPRKMVIDVITPTFRVNKNFLQTIIDLPVPSFCETMIVVKVDDPSADISWLRKLEQERFGSLRVRKNIVNVGASGSRNAGLDESAADWVIFLDDDVVPDGSLILKYASAIWKHGTDADGFVGLTTLPQDNRVFSNAVKLSDISYFWDIAVKMEKSPWSITANMAVRNSNLRFDTQFIKTGGGEDIDYCLQLKKWPLICVPEAKVIHPWWDEGRRCYGHFYRWAIGDSVLMKKYPQLTYCNCPNVWELTLILLLLAPVLRWSVLFCSVLSAWCADIAMDVTRNMFEAVRYTAYPVRGCTRLWASIESNLVKNSCELGHLLGPLSRGEITCIGRRFDWFCGMIPEVVVNEKRKHFYRFLVFMVSMLVVTRIFM